MKYISVKFKTTNKTYIFSLEDPSIKMGDYVVVETVRGLECALVVSDQMDTAFVQTEIKGIIRKATVEDEKAYLENLKEQTNESM